MELTKTDVFQIITLIKINYENAYNYDSEKTKILVNCWHDALKGYSKELCEWATQTAIKKSKFAPRLADILEQIENTIKLKDKTDGELWEELTVALSVAENKAFLLKYEFNRPKALEELKQLFKSLSPELKEYVVSIEGLIKLTTYDQEYERVRFMKVIPAIKERLRFMAKVSDMLLTQNLEDKKLLGE